VINEKHHKQLEESGIGPAQRGELERSGLIQSVDGGLRFNYPDTEGFYRIRLDVPRKKQKYTNPSGSKPRLYLPGADDKAVPIFIVEGEKKAIASNIRFGAKAVVVGLGGVWNWTGGVDGDDRILIDDFNKLSLNKRKVYIVFDSDIVDNKQVQEAERELSAALRNKGADVYLLTLPPEHKGIDDWFVAWGKNWDGELNKIVRAGTKYRGVDRLEETYAKVYTFADMVGTKFPAPKFFCGTEEFGIVSQGGICIIHGTTNVGNTYLATQLAVCIATGEAWLSHQCRASEVLYFQGELPPGLYARGSTLRTRHTHNERDTQTERDTHTERDALIQEETHTPES